MAKTNSGLLEFKDAQKVLIALDDATSEVKKAVVIDADGVETDIQGVQPTGKKEITSTAEVNVANYATAQVVDADLVAGNIKKDVDILGVVGSYEAGASDFSTAEVTIITASGKANTIIFPFVYDGEYSAVGATFNNEGTHTFTVPLYKGEGDATIASIEEINISVTGNIEYVEADGIFIITGDGSITISAGE